MATNSRSYSELCKLETFEERFQYLKLDGKVCDETFGSKRYLNQILYTSPEWKRFKHQMVVRDEGCDLGVKGWELEKSITLHHINPISVEDILERRQCVFDPENVICTSSQTHRAIHYGDGNLLAMELHERSKNDTCPWKR